MHGLNEMIERQNRAVFHEYRDAMNDGNVARAVKIVLANRDLFHASTVAEAEAHNK